VTTHAKELFEASVDHVRSGRLRPALTSLLDALTADPAHADSLEAASKLCRMLGATEDAVLFENLRQRPDDAEALYALGYRLVDQGRPDAAAAFFRRSLARLSNEPAQDPTRVHIVRRELAYAEFLDRNFEGALRSLGAISLGDGLADAEVLDVRLLQSEAALYLGRPDLCGQYLEEAEKSVPDDPHRVRIDTVHAMLGRSRRWPQLKEAGLREWHYIQHAGVLLKTAGGYFEDGSRAGRFEVLELRIDMVAFLLRRLADLAQRLGIHWEVIVPASDLAAPMAHALAGLLGVSAAADLTGREGRRGLLLAANAGELEPLCAGLARNRSSLHVFSLNLDWTRDNTLMPEMVGVLAQRVFLPWETRYSMDPDSGEMKEVPGDGRPAREIAVELLAAIAALPDDGGTAREEFESFYMPLTDALVLDNESAHPMRHQFTHLSPCWKPVGPRAAGDQQGDEPST
jgi:tetratricopeptide (TPR) repeat protein